MKKQLIFWIFLSVIVSANEQKLIDENKNISVYLDEKPSNSQLLEAIDANKKYQKDTTTDILKYQKVSLMDVVLETVSNSDLLKAAREQVIQSEIKLKDAIAGYYPTLNFESETARTQAHDIGGDKRYKYFNDRNYKFILNQNLYSGGDTSNTIKSLEKKLDLEKNQYEIVLQEQIIKAVKAYFDVVFSHRTVIATENNMKNLNKILEIVTVKYDNGAATIGDLTAIKANVSNAQTQLTKVRAKLTESLRYYEYMVGENYSQTIPYEKNFNINVSTFDLLYERGIKRNGTIMNYYKSIEAEKFNLKSKESAFAPKLDFELSLDNVMDKEGYEEREQALNGLFRLTFNLYNGGKDKNKILTSYSAIREANFKLDEEKKKLKWNISKLFTSIQSTNESLKSNISEVISLRKMVEAYWEEFTLGQQDLQALLQGHKQLNAAETELIKYENNNITDFFTLLGYTGDLLAFFDMDPEHPKFIDFSKSNYSNDVYIDDKFLNEKERLEKEEEIKKAEELRKMFAEKAAKDENIDNFIKKFLATSDEFYTIEIGSFNNQKDATNFIKEKQFDKNAFAYDTVENTNINSKIAYGIFPNMEMAKSESENLSKITNRKTLVVKKVKDVKKLHNDYVVGLKVKLPDPEVQVVEKINTIEKIKQEKKEPEFQYNEAFKNSFLTANKEAYTINITSFNNKNELEKILKANPTLLENSIAYNYSNGTPLIRWDYGIYETYEEAQKAIESLGEVGDSYYPVVQKISKEQELYNANIIPEVKKEIKETEFEYINVSSKVEYKNPIPLKEDKKIENKVQKTESKPAKEKDEEVKEVVKKLEQMPIIKKQEEIKAVSKKPDPKPIKEKDEVEVKEVVKKLEQMPIIKKQEEIKQVSKKADPKPIKEKDEEIVPVTRTIDAKPKKEPDVIDERVPLGGVR
jgi:outer membrane protein TolC